MPYSLPIARQALIVLMAVLCLAGCSAAPAFAQERPPAEKPADLVYLNRSIYTMRVTIAGATPASRARSALERLRALDENHLVLPISLDRVVWNGQPVITLRIADRTLLTVFTADLEADSGATLDEVAQRSSSMLQDALAARLEMQRPQTLWRGSLVVLASLIALIGVVWIEVRAGRSLLERIQALVNRQASTHRILGIDWSDYAFSVIGRALQLAMLVVTAGLVYLWLGLAFEQFPATAPIALGMGHALRSTLEDVTAQFFKVLPDIGMIALVLIAARGAAWMVASIFDGAVAGSFRIPGLHADTARATRRIAMALVWGLALAALYPFLARGLCAARTSGPANEWAERRTPTERAAT